MSITEAEAADALHALAQSSEDDLARLLLRAFRTVSAAVLVRVDPSGATGVRGPHVAIIAALDAAGTRMVVLAQRAGVTRQAASQLVHELAELGMVEIAPDPHDKRATVVRLTAAGAELCKKAAVEISQAERQWAAAVGDAGFEGLRATLHALIDAAGP